MSENELPPIQVRDDYVSEDTKTLISTLPQDQDFNGKICKYQGCWYFYNTLQAIINFQRNFKPLDTDIILATFPKSGTTWLKALTISLLERSKHRSDDLLTNHPLLSDNPHGIVPFFEFNLYLKTSTPDLTKYSSTPRLFSTHMPLHTLKEPLKDSTCKIVYLCRNIKDLLISRWYFRSKYQKKNEVVRTILESMFESFCSGVSFYGPFWDHALSYWRGSLEDPEHVLFMKYEELKTEPKVQVKRLAEFLGCPFTEEEEQNGLIEEILDLCSFDTLSGLEINKTGKKWNNMEYRNYFRKGEVGDSKNYLTTEMEDKIDMIMAEKLKGSGLKF